MRKAISILLMTTFATGASAQSFETLAQSLSEQVAPHIGVPVDLERSGLSITFNGLVQLECGCQTFPWARSKVVIDMTTGTFVLEMYDWQNLEGFGREPIVIEGYMADQEGVYFWGQKERSLVGPSARQSFFEGRVRLSMAGSDVYVLSGPVVGLATHDKVDAPIQGRIVMVEAR